jgi:hypothetical protein
MRISIDIRRLGRKVRFLTGRRENAGFIGWVAHLPLAGTLALSLFILSEVEVAEKALRAIIFAYQRKS